MGYLARQAATWHVLHTYRHQGLAAAISALGERGGCGCEDDGMFRSWFAQPRGWIRVQVGSMRVPVQRIRVAEVLAWADRQLTTGEWARVEQLVTTYRAARRQAHQVRQTAATRTGVPASSPSRLIEFTRAESARLAELGATERAADRELARLLLDAYAAGDRVGRQLDLFDLAAQPSAGRG